MVSLSLGGLIKNEQLRIFVYQLDTQKDFVYDKNICAETQKDFVHGNLPMAKLFLYIFLYNLLLKKLLS